MKASEYYYPVLRWKGAEIAAICDLTKKLRHRMKPLFELVPHSFEGLPLERAMQICAHDIAANWSWKLPCFIDPSLLGAANATNAYTLLSRQEDLAAILATSLRTTVDPLVFRDLARVRTYGLCIRIDAHDFQQTNTVSDLFEMVDRVGLTPKEIDLFIDFGVVAAPPSNLSDLVARADSIGTWRNIVLLSGAFPPDLSKLRKNEQHLLPRHDWLAYCRYAKDGGLAGFGDYTIQHPVYEEHEGKRFNFSASIRYTGLTDWVIMRGESVLTEGGPGYAQWPANAQILVAHSEFVGAEFSSGDSFIKAMSSQCERTGSSKDWLAAGINHHIAMVLYQIERVSSMPTTSVSSREAATDWPASVREEIVTPKTDADV